jgi:predicted CopG family antitoxin
MNDPPPVSDGSSGFGVPGALMGDDVTEVFYIDKQRLPYMKSRTINISDHTYNILIRRRHGTEGFDDIIVRMEAGLFRKKTRRDIMSFAGMLNDDMAEGIRNKVVEQRAKADRDFLEQVESRST